MDSQKQDGIQKLLLAEQEANAIVTAARQGWCWFVFFLVLSGLFFLSRAARARAFRFCFSFLVRIKQRDRWWKKILTRTLLLLLRVEKTARIKQAKDEAEAEIQSYRNQREQQYQQMLAQATGGSDEMARELETKAKQAEANMRATIEKKGANVTGMLVKHVTSVQL